MKRRILNSKGISLLEVIVAMALISTVMISGFQFSIGALRSIQRNRDQVRHAMISRSVVAWWERLSDAERDTVVSDTFVSVPAEAGLKHTDTVLWRLQRISDDSENFQYFIEIESFGHRRSMTPVTYRGTP